MPKDTPQDVVIREALAEKLNERRKALGLTIEQVGTALDLSAAAVHNIMTGKHNYSVVLLAKLAEVLDMPLTSMVLVAERREIRESPVMARVGRLLDQARERLKKVGEANPPEEK